MYAIIETGGKQYRVSQGETLKVEKLRADEGDTVEIDRVLAIGGEDVDFQVGTPTVEGARVKLNVLEHGRGKKIIVFKYKPKKNYRRKQGHRQPYTKVRVDAIQIEK